MILRAVVLVGGLTGAAATSQFPEFSQQYMQRLGGAVDALGEVVADFDTSAQAVDLTREAALDQMQGTDFLDRRRADMTMTFARYEKLSIDLMTLQGQGPFMRAYALPRRADAQIARAAWEAYQPAMPLNLAGALFAVFGFVVAGTALAAVLKALSWPFMRRPA